MLIISVQAKPKPGTSFDSGLESSTLVIDEGQKDPRIPKIKREKSFRIPRSMNSALQDLSDTESEPSPAKRPKITDPKLSDPKLPKLPEPAQTTQQAGEVKAPQAGIPE